MGNQKTTRQEDNIVDAKTPETEQDPKMTLGDAIAKLFEKGFKNSYRQGNSFEHCMERCEDDGTILTIRITCNGNKTVSHVKFSISRSIPTSSIDDINFGKRDEFLDLFRK